MKFTASFVAASIALFVLMGSTPRAAHAVSVVSGVWTIDYDVELFKKVGSNPHFQGSFSFDGDSLSGVGKEVLKYQAGVTAASIKFKGVTYTPTTPRRAKAKFIDGELIGLTFKFKHKNGSFLRVKFDDFVRGKRLRGAVDYDDAAYVAALASAQGGSAPAGGDVVQMPTPTAAAAGMAMLAAMIFKRRRKQAD